MAYTSNTEFDAETRVQKTNEVRPLDIYEGVHSILKRDIWKWLLGWSDTTTDLNYDTERAKNDPTYDYTDDVYPAKVVNGVPAPEYGDKLVKTVWNPNRVDDLGNPLAPDYEEVPAKNQVRMEIDGTILPEHDLFLHEIYRYLSNLYPDHPDWIELLTHTEIVDAFENAAAMVDYKPDDKFFLLVAQNMENVSNIKDAEDAEIDEIKKEELKLLLRNLTNNSFRRKFYGASDGMKMFASGVNELASVFPVGEYLTLAPIQINKGQVEVDPTKDPESLVMDIFDPNFKKPFRIIDWTGQSRDLPDEVDSQVEISGYSIPGASSTIIEIHELDDKDPLSNSAESIVNSRTFFRLPNNKNNITYYSDTDKSQIKSYSEIEYDENNKIKGYSTLKPFVTVIKYDTTQKLPIFFDTLYNYGTWKSSYDVSKKVGFINAQRAIERRWKDISPEDTEGISKVLFSNVDQSAPGDIVACILRNEPAKEIRYTIDPITNGLILEPSEMMKLYQDEPSFTWNKSTKEWDLDEDRIDDEKVNPHLKDLPIKKGQLLSSSLLVDDYSQYSFYSYIGSNKGKISLNCTPFYKEGDPYPMNFGEFSSSLLTSDYTSKVFSYGLVLETSQDKKIVLFGSIHPIWDVSTGYIQPTSIDFNLKYIPEYKDHELLKFLYGENYESKYSMEEIIELRKNREYFTITESSTIEKLNKVFENFDFNEIDLNAPFVNIDLRALVDQYDDKSLGQFLVFHQYMNTVCNMLLEKDMPLPEKFSFVHTDTMLKTFLMDSNKDVVLTSSMDIVKSNKKYTLKGHYLDNTDDTFTMSYINDYESVYEDFTFGKFSVVDQVFLISKNRNAESLEKAELQYSIVEGIPNTSVISQINFGHLNVVEFSNNFNEGYSYVNSFAKSTQLGEKEAITPDNYQKYYDFDVFEMTLRDYSSKDPNATLTRTVAFPKVNPKLSEIYGTTNDVKLNIIGDLLWKSFLERVSPKDGKYIAETLIPTQLDIEATRETDTDNDLALRTLIFSGEENLRKYEALTTGDTVEGNGIPSGTYIIQKSNNEVVLNNSIPKSGTHIYKFFCTVEAYPTDVRENFINYKLRLRDEGSLVSTSPFNNGLWGSNEWPHVSQAYIDGLVDPQDFSPINPLTTADIIYEKKLQDARDNIPVKRVADIDYYVPLSSVSIGTKMYYELNLKKLIHLPNRLGQIDNLMNVEWLDYFDANIDQISQASEATNIGTNLMMQTDISGFFTRREDADYTDDDLKLKFQTFGYDTDTVPCYIQLGTGGTAYQKYFKSPSLVQKPTVYGATFFDHPIDDIAKQHEELVQKGGDWKKRFVYSVGDISVIESGSGLSSVDQPLFEMPLGEYDVQKNMSFKTEPGMNTGFKGITKLDTVSTSFQKQTFKNLTKKLPENEIQILNRAFIESKLTQDNDFWIYQGEWKPSIKAETVNGKNVLSIEYPELKVENPEPGKYYVFSIVDAFSDFITDEKGARTPVNIPATSSLAYYVDESGLHHTILSPDFAGVTFSFDSKSAGTNTPYLQKLIEGEAGTTITKYIPIYTSIADNTLESFKSSLAGFLSDTENGDKVFTGKTDTITFKHYNKIDINGDIYSYTQNNETFIITNDKHETVDTIKYSFDLKTKKLTISKSNSSLISTGVYTTTSDWPSDEHFTKVNKILHACYVIGHMPSAYYTREDLANSMEIIYNNFYRDEKAKIPIIAYVSEEGDKDNKKLTLNYEVMVLDPIDYKSLSEEDKLKERYKLPTLIPLYEGLFASSIAFDSNNRPDELSFFDGTFGTVYISKDIKVEGQTVREYTLSTVDSGLRTIQEHQNKVKLPRSFVADGSYNIELTLDPHFISEGYVYNDDDTINTEKLETFNISQSRIYYDDVNRAFYTFADIYNKVPLEGQEEVPEEDKEYTFEKDPERLEKKVALSFKEQKFFKDTTYLEASLKAYTTQSEGNKETNTIYSLEPIKGIPYNTSRYSSSDRILDIEEIAFRSESDYTYEPVVFSNFTELKGEAVGINKENKIVVGNFRKAANASQTETTKFSGDLKLIDPVNDVDNIAKVYPPKLSKLKVKKPFTGEKIESTEGSQAEMNFKFFKNYLIFEGAISTDAPSQIIASKSNGPEFEKVLKAINSGDEIKAVACLNGGSAQARKSIKITQKKLVIPQKIKWEKGEMIMAGIAHNSTTLTIYTKKVPSLEAVTELDGFAVITANIGDTTAEIKDITLLESSSDHQKHWIISLLNSNVKVIDVNPSMPGTVLKKFDAPQSDNAKKLIAADPDVVIYNEKDFTFDKFKASDLSIAEARDKVDNIERILYYSSPDGKYSETTTFYVDMSMQMPHRTNLANGIAGLSDSKLVSGNCYQVTETYESYHIKNEPYEQPSKVPTEEGITEKILDAPIVYTGDNETKNEVFVQGDDLFIKTKQIKSSKDERQTASQPYWITGKIPSVRDTLEQRLYSLDVNQFRDQEVGNTTVQGILTGAFDNALMAWNESKKVFGENWEKLSKEEKEQELNKDKGQYVSLRLKQAFSPYEYFLFETCKLEEKFRKEIVDLTAFEKAMKPGTVENIEYECVCKYKMPMENLKDGRKLVKNAEVEHTYFAEDQGKVINAYRKYVQDWLSYILPAVDDTVAGSNFILSENIKQAIINKSEVGTDAIFILKNNQTLKLSLDKVTCAADIHNADYWTAYTLPEQTFYLAGKAAGTCYVSRLADMGEEGKGPTEYSVPVETHVKSGYEITNLYKLGTTIVMSGYLDSLETIDGLKLEDGAMNTLKYNDPNYKKPYIMYCQPGKQNLTMIDLTEALAAAPDESLTVGEDTYSLKNCNLVIGSVSALNGKLIATLKPDTANSYFETKVEISKGTLPDSTIVKVRKIENTKTLGGADQVMVGTTNSILYWQEAGKGLINEANPDKNLYAIDYLYRGAVSFGTTPSISFKTSTMIQLTEGLQADENTESAFYRYLFAVKTQEPITNPFDYYKFSEEYRDENTNLLKVGEVQEEVGDESKADKVYMFREAIGDTDPNPDGYPSMEEDTDKVFYEYDENGQIVYWTNNSGKPIYLCNSEGKLINKVYEKRAARSLKLGADGMVDDTWETVDGALYDFDTILENGQEFRQAGKPKLKDTQSFTELFEVFKEDKDFEALITDCEIDKWNSNFGGEVLDLNYFPSATLSANIDTSKIEAYLIEIKDKEVYDTYAANKDDRAAEIYINSIIDKASEILKVYPDGEKPEEAPTPSEKEIEEARAQYDTAINLLNLLRFIREKEGDFGSAGNPFESWQTRFVLETLNGKYFIFDKKYDVFMLNKIRYVDALLKVLYPSSVQLINRKITGYNGLYRDGKLKGIGPDEKYPVTGIYYPLKGYGGLMNEVKEWDGSYLPWDSKDTKAFTENILMNSEETPQEVLLYNKHGIPILTADKKVIPSKEPAYDSFDTMVVKDGRSVSLGSEIVSRKDGSILSFGGVTPAATEVFFGKSFPNELKVTPGKEKQIRIRVLSIADTTDIGDPYKLNTYEDNYKAYEEISKNEIEIFPPNRVYFNPLGIPEPPIEGTQIIASNDIFAPVEMMDVRMLLSSKIFKSKNNYAFYNEPYTNNNGMPIYECNVDGELIKYEYDSDEAPTVENFDDNKVQPRRLKNEEASYTSGVLFNPKRPIYNTCEEWFMKEFYLRGQESNPFWQVIKVYPEFNTNTMRFDSKSKVFEYAKGSEAMQLVECSPEDTYVMMKKTTLRKTEGTKTTVVPNASYIDLLPGEVYFLLSQPENVTFKTDPSFVKFGISYTNSFNEKTGIHRDIWKDKHVVNLPSAINVSYTINTTEDFADPDNKDAGIVRVSELALLDKNHQIVAYATFPPIEYRSDTQHISFTCFINHTACSDYHNK